ncbi:YuiB family protein [Bacillus sp. JCM 19034]|uniref:YuiB family protein n=1 Tax=Bacillus sp. JCM 19034 TaxID=1481928 RepID=UPI000781A300|nr:YuiB family protein [Bacillus sp. JCM 19034]
MNIPQLIISIVLFLVLFFGIGFLLNMVLRSTWIMAFIYPLVIIWIVNDAKLIDYVTQPSVAFSSIGEHLFALQLVDMIILFSGFAGAIISGIVIKMLRVRGYQMF